MKTESSVSAESNSNAIVIAPKTLATLTQMDSIAEQGRLALSKTSNAFEKAFLLAEAMHLLRQLLTPEIMTPVMELQGSALGFKTDKDTGNNPGYPVEVVKDCVIEAALLGLYPTSNEFNIIAGRCYAAKNGLGRLVKNYPGLTDLSMTPGVPVNKEGGTLVPYVATFKINGKDQRVERTFPIRVNAGAIVDATLGKAKRKMYAAILEHVTGSEISEGEAGDDVMPGAPAATAGTGKRAPVPKEKSVAGSDATVPADTNSGGSHEGLDKGPGGRRDDGQNNEVTGPEKAADTAAPTNPPGESTPETTTALTDEEQEIKLKEEQLLLIRQDQEAHGWADKEMTDILKQGYGFPKHSETVKEIDDCTLGFLQMVVKALPGLNKAIEKARSKK